MEPKAKKLCGVISLTVVGLLLIAGGITLQKLFPGLMASQLDKKLILSEDSPTIGNFIAPPVPIFMQFYFFNVTNPEDVLYGDMPDLQQIGPYTYEETREKYDLIWEEGGKTVTYKQNKTFFFRPDLSPGLSEDDMITTLNAPMVSLASKMDKSSLLDFFSQSVMSVLMMRFELNIFITKPAGELLFKGYEEPLLEELSYITGDPIHALGRFGFFFPKNDSNDGAYRIFTGASGLEKLQLIDEWREEPRLEFWSTDYCNMLNGTEGAQFPRPITEDTPVWMYSSDLCRSLYLKYEKTIDHGGLKLHRYVLPFEVLEQSPATDCYCTDDFTCRDSMVNLSPCKKGAPVVASTPHFYMGTNETINAVKGLNPNKEEHETYLDVEPNTGVTFRAHKRIQISMPLKRYSAVSSLSEVPEVVLPILWLNESAEVPLERAEALHSKLTVPPMVANYVSWGLVVLGCLFVLLAMFLAFQAVRTAPTPPTTHKDVKAKPLEQVDYQKSEQYKHLFT